MCSAPWYSKTRRRSLKAADRGDVADEDRRAQQPLDQPEEERRAELVLDQAGQPDRDDEEEADRQQQREEDRQAPDPAADLLLLALLVLLHLRVGGDRQRLEADLHRLAEGDDAANHRHPPERGGAWPRGRAARTRPRSRPRVCGRRRPRSRRRASSPPPAPPARRPARRAWRPARRRACAAGRLRWRRPASPAAEPTSGLTAYFLALACFAARRWNRSTRPPVSTSFCLPV